MNLNDLRAELRFSIELEDVSGIRLDFDAQMQLGSGPTTFRLRFADVYPTVVNLNSFRASPIKTDGQNKLPEHLSGSSTAAGSLTTGVNNNFESGGSREEERGVEQFLQGRFIKVEASGDEVGVRVRSRGRGEERQRGRSHGEVREGDFTEARRGRRVDSMVGRLGSKRDTQSKGRDGDTRERSRLHSWEEEALSYGEEAACKDRVWEKAFGYGGKAACRHSLRKEKQSSQLWRRKPACIHSLKGRYEEGEEEGSNKLGASCLHRKPLKTT